MPRANRKVPLHICISVMLTVLMVLVSAAMGYYSYRQASHIILASSEQVFQGIEHDVQQDLAATFEPVEGLLHLIAANKALTSTDLRQRLALLPSLHQALRANPRLASLYVGYGNGDFFMARALRSDAQRTALDAPDAASVQVWSIEHGASRSLFFDANLAPLGEGVPPARLYDPRERPWYTSATQHPGVIGTDPYVFYSDRRVGTTLAIDTGAGQVLGADITLDELSATLARHRVTPNTQLALYDRLGHAVAYPEAGRVVAERNSAELEQVSTLHPALALFVGQPQQPRLILDGEEWIVASHALQRGGPSGLSLALLVPERERLARAYALRWQGALITLTALLLCLPLGWLSARLLVAPLRRLVRDVEQLGSTVTPSPPATGSLVLELHQLQCAVAALERRLATQAAARLRIAGQPETRRWGQWLDEACAAAQARAALLYLRQGDDLQAVSCRLDGQAYAPPGMGIPSLPARGPWPDWLNAGDAQGLGMISVGFDHAGPLQTLMQALQCPRVNVLSLALDGGWLVLLRADQGEPLEVANANGAALRQLASLMPLLGATPLPGP